MDSFNLNVEHEETGYLLSKLPSGGSVFPSMNEEPLKLNMQHNFLLSSPTRTPDSHSISDICMDDELNDVFALEQESPSGGYSRMIIGNNNRIYNILEENSFEEMEVMENKSVEPQALKEEENKSQVVKTLSTKPKEERVSKFLRKKKLSCAKNYKLSYLSSNQRINRNPFPKKIKKCPKGPIQKNSLKILGDRCIRNLIDLLTKEEDSQEKQMLMFIIKYSKSESLDYKELEKTHTKITKKMFLDWIRKNWNGKMRSLNKYREAFDYKNRKLSVLEAHFRRVLCFHSKNFFMSSELINYISKFKNSDKSATYSKIASGIANLIYHPHKIRCLTQFL